jgi:hypothetical protein
LKVSVLLVSEQERTETTKSYKEEPMETTSWEKKLLPSTQLNLL